MGFMLYEVEDIVRIPPNSLDKDPRETVLERLKLKYENIYDEEMGYIILVRNPKIPKYGRLVHGDGSVYCTVKFEVLSYKFEVQEIVEGEVVEAAEFGAFVRVGPIDALLHISQVMDDYVEADIVRGMFVGKETKRVLRVGDIIRARVVAVSPPRGASEGKVGLTCRQPFLGALSWIEEEVKRVAAEGEEGRKG